MISPGILPLITTVVLSFAALLSSVHADTIVGIPIGVSPVDSDKKVHVLTIKEFVLDEDGNIKDWTIKEKWVDSHGNMTDAPNPNPEGDDYPEPGDEDSRENLLLQKGGDLENLMKGERAEIDPKSPLGKHLSRKGSGLGPVWNPPEGGAGIDNEFDPGNGGVFDPNGGSIAGQLKNKKKSNITGAIKVPGVGGGGDDDDGYHYGNPKDPIGDLPGPPELVNPSWGSIGAAPALESDFSGMERARTLFNNARGTTNRHTAIPAITSVPSYGVPSSIGAPAPYHPAAMMGTIPTGTNAAGMGRATIAAPGANTTSLSPANTTTARR